MSYNCIGVSLKTSPYEIEPTGLTCKARQKIMEILNAHSRLISAINEIFLRLSPDQIIETRNSSEVTVRRASTYHIDLCELVKMEWDVS